MNLADLSLLLDYNDWANRRILTAAARVTPEQYAAPSDFPRSSLRATLIHILDAQYGWRLLLERQTETPDLTEADFPSLDSLLARWHEEDLALRHYLSTLTDELVSGTIRYTNHAGLNRERVRWHCLLHVVNHGTQHRSEAAALLTRYGQSPGDLDMSMYLIEGGSSK